MRILQLHCDYIRFKPKTKALKNAAELDEKEKQGGKLENVLVIFSSFEQGDDEAVLNEAAREVEKNYREVKADALLVYPYAHLSSNLAGPEDATRLLEGFWNRARKFAPNAEKAPFGYYKEFELKCKGHPLSELSKTIDKKSLEASAERLGAKEVIVEAPREKEVVSESLKQEAKAKSVFFVLTPEGELVDARKFDYRDFPELKKLADYELAKVRAYAEEPPHIRIMKDHGLVRYEPATDAGNFSWLPNGVVVKRLLEKAITDVLLDYGAMEVETPIMYSFEHPSLKKYLNRFPARQYIVKSDDRDFFLRFAACFGQFLIKHDAVISYKNLPLKMYELTRYSFRREQSGELCGLKRLRAFTMPDMHTVCRDLAQAREEFESQYRKCLEWNQDLGISVEATFRAQTDFFNENKAWYVSLVRKIGKPVLFELFDIRYAYFVTKFEFNFIDNAGKASGLSTVQIDIENAETYDISFIDEDGKKKRPPILHASIPGAIERVVYALLEREAARAKEGKVPSLPLWLSPTQIRIVPVSDKQDDYCEKVLRELSEQTRQPVRIDYDDRPETLQKKIREAEMQWIPLIAVIGDKEIAEEKLSVRIRGRAKAELLSADELIELIKNECGGKPFYKHALPQRLSRRPLLS